MDADKNTGKTDAHGAVKMPRKWRSHSTEIVQEMYFLRFFGTLAILTILFVLGLRFVQQTSSLSDRPQSGQQQQQATTATEAGR